MSPPQPLLLLLLLSAVPSPSFSAVAAAATVVDVAREEDKGRGASQKGLSSRLSRKRRREGAEKSQGLSGKETRRPSDGLSVH